MPRGHLPSERAARNIIAKQVAANAARTIEGRIAAELPAGMTLDTASAEELEFAVLAAADNTAAGGSAPRRALCTACRSDRGDRWAVAQHACTPKQSHVRHRIYD